MNSKTKIAIGLTVIVVLVIGFILTRTTPAKHSEDSAVPTTEPLDVVLDFYGQWSAVLASSTAPFESELFASTNFAPELRSALTVARAENPAFDPISCQTGVVPERFRGRVYPASETEAKVLVEARMGKNSLPEMAFITVKAVAGEWQITAIDCTVGDVAPEVEFNYDREGLLLKSVPPPYEAGKWHLVFEQDGQMGYVTPLFFSATTTCVARNGEVSVCNPDTFTETARVIVKGGMTEIGAEVVRLEFQ